MHYETIVQELLQQRRELHEQLRTTRQLLPTIDALATSLRDHHLALTETMVEFPVSRIGHTKCVARKRGRSSFVERKRRSEES